MSTTPFYSLAKFLHKHLFPPAAKALQFALQNVDQTVVHLNSTSTGVFSPDWLLPRAVSDVGPTGKLEQIAELYLPYRCVWKHAALIA